MAAGHVRISLTVGRGIVEIAPAVDHLLRRAAADAELQPPAGDQIRRAGVFHHVQRVFITHVDHASADLDALGFGADGGQQRERRSQLARKVVYAKIGAVRPQIFGGDRQIDGLQQRIRCGTGAGLGGRRPVAEREKTNLFIGNHPQRQNHRPTVTKSRALRQQNRPRPH